VVFRAGQQQLLMLDEEHFQILGISRDTIHVIQILIEGRRGNVQNGAIAYYLLDKECLMDRIRVDKWLWAARFFKTRSLATQAVEGGRVKLNGERCKPAKEVRAGDQLIIHIGHYEWEVAVVELSDRRGPATAARLLYQEAEKSLALRQALMEERRMQLNPAAPIKGRPTKRDRRKIHRFTEEFE
jgi:ribosome-associated heat shock protein Hsp15